MSENLLEYEASPYLRQHADNPVHWRPWGPEALAEASRTGKPILLSVGYAACHWCHVMAHESFEDPEVAAVMNDLYINIKVDREERPDVDQLYMDALHLLGEHGGWPLTMFLTPEGDAVWGGTYFPKEPKYGRPGFVQVLTEFHRLFRDEPQRIAHNRDAIRARLSAPSQEGGARLEHGLVEKTARRLLAAFDPVHGGLKGAPKFPQTTLLKLIWRGGLATGEAEPFDAVTFALERMSRGGIYDHLGGGFSRYSVDEQWLVPHFEKMLYDNALLLDLLVLAWLRTGEALFRERIVDTVGWLGREMTTETGAFAASLDADSDGQEGLFYTWTRAEIDAVLGPDADAFATAYGVTPEGNFEGRAILNRLADPFPLSEAEEARLTDCRAMLFDARAPRVRPARDDKVLADWNGLMIAALARASSALDMPQWRAMAETAYRCITESMTHDGRVAHSLLGDKLVFPGLSSDHAAMIEAALALHEATGEGRYLVEAQASAAALDTHHWDEAAGGYFLAAADTADLSIRLKHGHDDAIPNPNGQMVANLSRLWRLTGEARYRDRADAILDAYSGAILRNPAGHASLLSGLDQRLDAIDIVVVGAADDTRRRALETAARAVPDPNASVRAVAPDGLLPREHPAAGKGLVEGRAAAYVCRGETCSLPLAEPRELHEAARRAPTAA